MSSAQYPPPLAIRAFTEKKWKNMNKEEIEKKMQEAIIEDPATNATNVSVVFDPDANNGACELELIGTVKSELEYKRIEDVVKANTGGECPVKNNLKVK